MANIIKPRRTGTSSKVPTTSDLADGEMGVNIVDGKTYIRSGGTVYVIGEKNAAAPATLTFGSGLANGSYDGSGATTISLGTPSSTTLSSSNATTATSHTHAFAPGGTTNQYIRGDGSLATFPSIPSGTVTSVSAGNGMNFSTITGSGAVTLGTPGTLTGSTTNSVTSTSHTHALSTNLSSWDSFSPSSAGLGSSSGTTISDLDSVLGNATSFWNFTSASSGSLPSAGGSGMWLPYSTVIGSQMVLQPTANRAFLRGYNLGWTDWAEIVTTVNGVPNNTKLPFGAGGVRNNDSAGLVLSSNSFPVYIRPNGDSSTSGQAIFGTTGNLAISGEMSDQYGNVRKLNFVGSNATATADSTWLNAAIEKSNNSTYTYTIPSGLGSQADAITFVNSGTAGNLTVARGSGVSIYRNGVNANIVVGPGSIVTIYRSATSNRWIA